MACCRQKCPGAAWPVLVVPRAPSLCGDHKAVRCDITGGKSRRTVWKAHAWSMHVPSSDQITTHGHFAYSSPDMNCSREPPICDMHLYTLCLWVALFCSLSPGVPAEHKYAACWGLVLGTKGLHICMNFSPNSCAKSVCTLLRQLPAPNQKLGILLRRWDHCNSQSQWSHAPKSLLTSRHHKYLKGSGDASVKRLKQHFLTLYYT